MSRKFVTNIDLNLNQLLNVLAQILVSDPGSPTEGQFWYNSTTHLFKWYDGTVTHSADDVSKLNGQLASYYLARANHTGTQTASTISDLAAVVQAYRLDQFASPTSDLNINSHKLTNVQDPTAAQHAATKNYVDNLLAGLSWKAAVRAASTVNGTLATAYANGQVIDGVTLATADRILLKNQTTGADNGIYIVAASGAPTRATDDDGNSEMLQAAVFVEEGTINADTGWVCTTNAPITVGSTSLSFVQFNGTGTTYSAGNGLQLVSTTFSVVADTGILVSGSGVKLDTTVAVTKFSADVGDNSSTSIVVTHNLGTKDVVVQLYDKTTPFAQLECDVQHTSTTTITLLFAVAPTTNQYRVVCHA